MHHPRSSLSLAGVLLALGAVLSCLSIDEQWPAGADAGRDIARRIVAAHGPRARVVVAVLNQPDDQRLAQAVRDELTAAGAEVVETVTGGPARAAELLARLRAAGQTVDALAVSGTWQGFLDGGAEWTRLDAVPRYAPRPYRWPTFLKPANLLNIADQITVTAILAIGMTIVVIAGGIDLSVGSLVALGAVLTAVTIRDLGGGAAATPAATTGAAAVALGVCALAGLANGLVVTVGRVPPFIATLAMLLVASGAAGRLTRSESISDVPLAFTWLGRGSTPLGVPNQVVLTLLLYAAAHVLMTRTVLGRRLYAIGGNAEAARLAGVPVARTRLFAYTVSGLLAGLGGVIMCSQHKSAAATYGQGYELDVIAAVVVGGTSLAGGSGRMLGTLLGALLISVIRNGMNLLGLETNLQRVVLGLVILAAVLLDRGRPSG